MRQIKQMFEQGLSYALHFLVSAVMHTAAIGVASASAWGIYQPKIPDCFKR